MCIDFSGDLKVFQPFYALFLLMFQQQQSSNSNEQKTNEGGHASLFFRHRMVCILYLLIKISGKFSSCFPR